MIGRVKKPIKTSIPQTVYRVSQFVATVLKDVGVGTNLAMAQPLERAARPRRATFVDESRCAHGPAPRTGRAASKGHLSSAECQWVGPRSHSAGVAGSGTRDLAGHGPAPRRAARPQRATYELLQRVHDHVMADGHGPAPKRAARPQRATCGLL